MKITRLIALSVLLITAAVSLPTLAQEHPSRTEHPKQPEHPAKAGRLMKGSDFISILSSSGHFKTLLTAIEAAGLTGKFQGEGAYTVFAPTDDAFAKLPKGELEALLQPANKAKLAGILGAHVVPGAIMKADVKTMKATNVNGQDLEIVVSKRSLTVNGAAVVETDLMAGNGVIHAIDTVIFPAEKPEHPEAKKPKDHPAH